MFLVKAKAGDNSPQHQPSEPASDRREAHPLRPGIPEAQAEASGWAVCRHLVWLNIWAAHGRLQDWTWEQKGLSSWARISRNRCGPRGHSLRLGAWERADIPTVNPKHPRPYGQGALQEDQ